MENRYLITKHDPKSPLAEAYKTLRTNLQFLKLDKSLRSILFTSAGPGEGKSTTAANLAVAMAQAGQKILIIDGDLRKPVQHKVFGIGNSRGLTNLLVEAIDPREIIHKGPVEGLDVLPSGPIPPNPSELLSSEKMKELLTSLIETYEMVIIDAPPTVAVTDPVILSALVDGVIIVASAGQAQIDMLKHTKESLLRANARIIGTVLNKVDMSGDKYEYYYYYRKEAAASKSKKKFLGLF